MPSWDTLLANATCVSGLSLFLVLFHDSNKNLLHRLIFLYPDLFRVALVSQKVWCRLRWQDGGWEGPSRHLGEPVHWLQERLCQVVLHRLCEFLSRSFFFFEDDVLSFISVQPLIRFVFQDGQKQGYINDLPGKLKQFSDFLGDKKWFAGDNVCMRVLHKFNRCPIYHWLFSFFSLSPHRSLLWTSSCTSCWTSTGCFILLAWMTLPISKTSWIDLRRVHGSVSTTCLRFSLCCSTRELV